MTLIKCKECKKEISDKAPYCPHCGIVLNGEQPINDDPCSQKDDNLIKVSVNKEKCHIITIILSILISFFMYLTFISYGNQNFYFIKTSYTTYTLLESLENNTISLYAMLFTIFIGAFSFTSLILTLLSKKTFKFSKLCYLLNTIIMTIFFINIYLNNLRIGNQFIFIFIFNFILLILPRLDKIISVDTTIPKQKEKQIIRKNEKLIKLYEKKKTSLVKIIVYTIVILVNVISFILIVIFNNKEMQYYIQKNDNEHNQIKIINDYINVRNQPDSNSELLGKVRKNDIYNVLDKVGDEKFYWYKIEYKSEIAYIASEKNNPYVEELYSKDHSIKINIFYKPTCIHCKNALNYLNELKSDNTYKFNIVKYNVNEYKDLFIEVSDYFNLKNYLVPLIVVEDEYMQGFSESTKKELTTILAKQNKEKNNIVEQIKLGDLAK